jgi:AraC-like DNA-binding protein/mannose-6-phosphate isomerase-like protein (cupin superfamily)
MSRISATCDNEYRLVEPQINAQGVHVYPFDPSFPIDVRFLAADGGHNVRMNRHHYFELCFVSAGRTTMRIQDRLFPLRKGDLVVIGSDLYHAKIDLPNSPSRVTVLFFEPELIRITDRTSEEMEYLMPFLAQKPDFPHVIPARTGLPEEVDRLIRRVHAELPATTVRARLVVKTYLKMILALLLTHYASYLGRRQDIDRKRSDLERLRPFFDYLEKHYDAMILVEEAARLCAMSNSHFMYFFKRTTGQSFLSYVNHFRIAKAQLLLTHTDKPLASISQEVAFCNQSYFGMVFRKLVGVTPLAYRRRSGTGGDIGHLPLFSLPSQGYATEEAGGRSVTPNVTNLPTIHPDESPALKVIPTPRGHLLIPPMPGQIAIKPPSTV